MAAGELTWSKMSVFRRRLQMGVKKAKMAMEEVNENKDGISESTCNSNTFTFVPSSNDIAISIHHSNFVSSRS